MFMHLAYSVRECTRRSVELSSALEESKTYSFDVIVDDSAHRKSSGM